MNKYTVCYEDEILYYISADMFEINNDSVLFKNTKGEILAYFKREPIIAVIKKVEK